MSVEVSPFELAARAGEAPVRAEGVARLIAERMAGDTVAMEVDEQGPLRLRFPRIRAGDALDVVSVNTGGGVVGGDRLEFAIDACAGAAVSVTSQAAEKIYRSAGAAARISLRLSAAPRARLVWVPQETILFDRSRVSRSIEADIAEDASLTICESVVLGRAAMDERMESGMLRDRWRLRRDGKLIFADAVTLDGAIGAMLSGPAVAAGANGFATIVQVAPEAETKIDAVRTALAGEDIEAGASAFGGFLLARLLARDNLALRSTVLAALHALGVEPPRAFAL